MQSLVPSDPRVIGSWRVVGRLGSGGMGIVYLGERDGFRVAIKVVRASFLDDVSLKSRVVREISVLRKIKSLNVASIIEADVSSDFAWFASEFVDGPNLKQFVESSGALNFFQWLKLAEGLFEAFDVIHKQNVIHRDVKPSNILIGPDGPKVIDFGIALTDEATSLTTTGLVAGSPAWLSPEQINDKAITKSSDIFSIGSVLTFAATGNSPWNRENTTKTAVIFHRILTEKPNLQSLNQFQKEFIIKLLDKNPNKRPSAKEAKDLINKEIKRILNQSDKEFQAESELTKIYDRKELTSTEIFKPNKINKSKTNLNKTILVAASFAIFLTAAYFIINNISSNQPKEEIVAQELPQAIQSITSTPIATPTIEEPITEEFAATPTQIPTPKETPIQEVSKTQGSETQNTKGSKIIDVNGEKVDLVKTRICLTIFQLGKSDSYCYKETPVVKEPLFYVDGQNIGGFSRPLSELITLSVPFEKANIFGCFIKSWSGTFEYYTSGISEQILIDLGTWTIVYQDKHQLKFCEKYGDWKYGEKGLNIPLYEVLAFNKNASLPQDFTRIVHAGDKKYSYIWTWSK